jgi:hypothetical protein
MQQRSAKSNNNRKKREKIVNQSAPSSNMNVGKINKDRTTPILWSGIP